ncbi:uncharacterized protein LOC132631378 [Lycium barbarum]|uniref:uncharacterized protein LOC132631378 n=1 Tax=Lycium barbarum TaxID=112863 RepID=UPI00293EC99D|nr:uncharacterized protein LOC132631378 [Lycium barbarum]
MVISLSAKNKLGFVDGTCPKPNSDDTPEKIRQWDRCNNMVISWLTSSISPNIAESVQYSETAESIWKQLERRYGIVSGTKIFELKKELASTQQGSLDIASYFNKLKKYWNELGTMRKNHSNSCVCAVKTGIEKDEEEDRLYQFLMGLNEVYVGVRSSILMMNPLPHLDDAYNILLQDENQRQVQCTPQMAPEAASFNASSYTAKGPPPAFSSGNMNPRLPRPPAPHYNQRVDFDQSKASLICRYCKKPGHLIEQCYKLYGYPAHYKLKGKKTAATATGDFSTFRVPPQGFHAVPQNCAVPEGQKSIPGLTKEQISQLISLFQSNQLSSTSESATVMGSANFAGSTFSFDTFSMPGYNSDSHACLLSGVSKNVWIIDSGATDHITSDKTILSNLTPLPVPYLVTLPNGYKAKVNSIGFVTIFPSLVLHHVLYIPSFQYNLVSMHKLILQFHCMVLFTSVSCILIQDLSMRKLLALGKLDQGLYKLLQDKNLLPAPSNSSHVFSDNVHHSSIGTKFVSSIAAPTRSALHSVPTIPCIDVQHVNTNNVNKNDVLWHHRLGHIPFTKMKSISSISGVLSSRQSFICPVCPLARQSRLPFSPSISTSSSLFDLIHVDTWGPYHTPI